MLDRGLKQRMVGALVLMALAVIFVPMLLSGKNEQRPVEVDAPPMPASPAATAETSPQELRPGSVPEGFEIIEDEPGQAQAEAMPADAAPAQPAEPAVPDSPPPVTASPTAPAPVPDPASGAEQRLDAANLPVSWSVQLASLSNRQSAEALQAKLRAQGYNAYVRTVDGMNRVFVGPLIERAEAGKLRDQLHRQQKLDGFVVRFTPESR